MFQVRAVPPKGVPTKICDCGVVGVFRVNRAPCDCARFCAGAAQDGSCKEFPL